MAWLVCKNVSHRFDILREPKLLVEQQGFFVITKLQKAVDSVSGDEESKLR